MDQLLLFATDSQVADSPPADETETPTVTLRSYCKSCRRSPRAICPACKVRTYTYDAAIDCLRSLSKLTQHISKADTMTVILPGYGYTWRGAGQNLLGEAQEIFWQLLAAGVGGELAEAQDSATQLQFCSR